MASTYRRNCMKSMLNGTTGIIVFYPILSCFSYTAVAETRLAENSDTKLYTAGVQLINRLEGALKPPSEHAQRNSHVLLVPPQFHCDHRF